MLDVIIIGAGPYGLSTAAHLADCGVAYRIFGVPMQSWAQHMPRGMCLKSEGFASDIYDPHGRMTLRSYCEQSSIAYADVGLPVKLDTFVEYGLAFQRELVPTLEAQDVVRLKRLPQGFVVELASGETVAARAVIVATGVSYLGFVPQILSSLPKAVCSHSSEHSDLTGFNGREVIVIGGGASATDVAALLRAAGATVTLLARHPIKFHQPPGGPRSLWQRMRAPNLGLGPGLRSAAYTLFPRLFRLLPASLRLRIVATHLGPSGGWFVRDEVEGRIPIHLGYEVQDCEARGARVRLRAMDRHGRSLELEADHVVAATGYRVSLEKLRFLDSELIAALRLEKDGSPALSAGFESSVEDLYFVGLAGAATFGPLLRFALGAKYSARRLTSHLRRRQARLPAQASYVPSPAGAEE
jgi:hypothetical protein